MDYFWVFLAGVVVAALGLSAPILSSKISSEQECGVYANALLQIQWALNGAENDITWESHVIKRIQAITGEALQKGREIRG